MTERNHFRFGALVIGAVLVAGAGVTAFGQGHTHRNDPYYGNQDRDHEKQEKRAEKRHQKAEKEALKRHQRQERRVYGNDSAIREHQRQEREELKRHRRHEQEDRRAHQRDERDGRYDDGYNNNGSYDPYGRRRDPNYEYENDGYSNSRQATFDRGYQDGVGAGRDDRARNRRSNYENHSSYRNASSGNRNQYGDAEAFRDGFRRGYDEGYRDNGYSRNGNGIGSILGGIFGRQ